LLNHEDITKLIPTQLSDSSQTAIAANHQSHDAQAENAEGAAIVQSGDAAQVSFLFCILQKQFSLYLKNDPRFANLYLKP